MELRHCEKHDAMTYHELDSLVGWYCIKCTLDKCREETKRGRK